MSQVQTHLPKWFKIFDDPNAEPKKLASLIPSSDAEILETTDEALEEVNRGLNRGDLVRFRSGLQIYWACVYKLNGCKWESSMSIEGNSPGHRVARFCKSNGHCPGWGRAGDFLLLHEGIRVLVRIDWSTYWVFEPAIQFSASQPDMPFWSETGAIQNWPGQIPIGQKIFPWICNLLREWTRARHLVPLSEQGKRMIVLPDWARGERPHVEPMSP